MLREITLHCYERFHFNVMRDSTSLLREITPHCYERLSISIIQPAVYIYRRYDLTEDSLDVSFFNCSFWLTNLLRPSLLFATSSPLSPVYSYGGGSAQRRRLLICRQTSSLHLYSPRLRRRYRRSIPTALMRPSLFLR